MPEVGVQERERATSVVLAGLSFDGQGSEPIRDAAILIQDDRILGIEERGVGWAPPPNARVLGSESATVLPGFIDAHVHLAGLSATKADPATAAGAVTNAQAALSAGVTTVRDCGAPAELSFGLRSISGSDAWIGPRLVVCGAPVTTTGGHCYWMGGRADSIPELRHRVRQVAELGGDFIKMMLTGGMSTPGSNPYEPQYSVEEVTAVVEDAHRLGMKVAGHALSPGGIRVAIEAGVDTLEHGWTITGREQLFHEEIAEAIANAGHRMIASVTAHRDLRRLLPGNVEEDTTELMQRLSPHRTTASMGVPFVVHSDADGYHTALSEFGMSIEVFMLGMGVSFESALHAATGLAAEVVGLGEVTGRIEAGFAADLVVLDGDPRTDPSLLRAVDTVVLRGREVVKGGRLTPPGDRSVAPGRGETTWPPTPQKS